MEGIIVKNHSDDRQLIYVHMNHPNHFVLTHGIEFSEFLTGIPNKLSNVLLLKHQFSEGDFNMHVMLDYVTSEMVPRLAEEDVYGYGDFCWIDFLDEEGLYQLSGQEMAEILYIGHLKDHLRNPFYGKLNNQFVYLAGDDGWFNKTYYRMWNDFYSVLGSAISSKITLQKEKPLLSWRKKKSVPAVPIEILQPFMNLMKQGIVFSIEKTVRNRQMIEVPAWIIGDFYDMDAMYEEYEQLHDQRKPDAKIVFDRKSEEWQALANYSSLQDAKRGTTLKK